MNPVLVEVFRNDSVESFHRGAVIATNSSGEVLLELGDINAMVFPRSALKPVQAIPLLESGAAEYFSLSPREIALACASHNAQQEHQQVLSNWMKRLELDPSQLGCGAALPMHEQTAHETIRAGGSAARHLHNCSGKHTGMLTLAKYLKVSTEGYWEYNHETQQSWMKVLSELSGSDVTHYPWDRDGCGLPALCLPLVEFAAALAAFCDLQKHSTARASAMKSILTAMQSHPQMVAGSGRCCTATMTSCSGVVVKTGAEGVFAAIAAQAGVAIALKIDDGATRAADAALGAVLRKLGIISLSKYEALANWYTPNIVNSQGVTVGRLAPSAVWAF